MKSTTASLIFVFFIVGFDSVSQGCNCDFVIEPSESGRAYCANDDAECQITYGESIHVLPGDTICLMAGTHSRWLDFYNLIGTEEEPITIINCGGQAILAPDDKQHATDIWASEYLHFTGTGDPDYFYGIKIIGGLSGVKINHASRNYEVDHVEVIDCGEHGLDLKNDPSCDERTWRSTGWDLEWLKVHDVRIDGAKYEGFYIGNSHYDSERTVTCDEVKNVIEESSILDAEVYDCIVTNTGYDGIQVGSVSGQARIYNNHISNYGLLLNEFDQAGFQINPGTKAIIHDNIVLDGSGTAFFISGDGVEMYNNISINSKTGVSAFNKLTSETSSYKIYNNTFLGNTIAGIAVLPASFTIPSNFFYNNIVHWNSDAEYGDYRYKDTEAWLDESNLNNIYTDDIESLHFTDLDNYDFSLTAESVLALDLGDCSPVAEIETDGLGYVRSYGEGCDIGALEYTEVSLSINAPEVNFEAYFGIEKLANRYDEVYTIDASHLRSDVLIPMPENFRLSLDPDNFDNELDTLVLKMNEDEFRSFSMTVYVQFNPTNDGEISEDVLHITEDIETNSLTLKGETVVLSSVLDLEKSIKVYPNPIDSGSSVKIDLNKVPTKKAVIRLIDVIGKEYIYFESMDQNIEFMLPSNITNGIYVVIIKVDDDLEMRKKLRID